LDLIIKIKKIVPQYVRISRLVRDIPEESILAGNKQTNLRQVIENHSRLNNWKCQCIRCREIKDVVETRHGVSLRIDRIDYNASGGKEIFLQYVDGNNKLYAMLRLRITNIGTGFKPVPTNYAVIREVHTYGEAVDVGDEIKNAKQHKGLGKKLIAEAEKITRREFGLSKIAVIAGIGTRNYYKKLGYIEKNTYMVKNI